MSCSPAGEVALFDMLVQIALMAVPVTADEFLRLGIGEVLDRTVGGMRASIYNAMPIEGVEKLVEFMKKFEAENK